jgi:hypothetical protein
MTNPAELHPLADTYVRELRSAARRLPRAQRNELVAEITAHLAETAPASASQAEALTALERLGEPTDILNEQVTQAPAPARRLGSHEIAAILLLMFGGFVVFVGWLAGVFLLWTSGRWTMREKAIGTLVVPGGYATAAYALLLTSSVTRCSGSRGLVTCVGGPTTLQQVGQIAVLVFVMAGPLASAFFLAKRAR